MDGSGTLLENMNTGRPRWIENGIHILSGAMRRRGIVALADQAIVSASNFLTGAIIGRVCTKEEFGLYMLGFSIVLFIVEMQTSLISEPYTLYSPRLKGIAHSHYTGSTLIHHIGLTASAIVFLVVTGLVLSIGLRMQEFASVVFVLVFIIEFIMLRHYARRVCFACLQMTTAFALDSCIAIIQIGSVLLLAYLGWLSADRAYWVIGAASGICTLGWFISNRRIFVLRFTEAISDLRLNWSIGKWIFAGYITFLTSSQLYYWLLNCFQGMAATGIFSACMGVVLLSNPLILGMSNFLGPKTSHALGRVEEVCAVVIRATFLLAVVMGIFCLVILFFGNQLVILIYGSKYKGNGLVTFLLGLGAFAWALTCPIGYGIWAMERPDLNFKVNLIAVAISLIFGTWFIRSFGLEGAAIAFLIGNSAASIARYVAFFKLVATLASQRSKC